MHEHKPNVEDFESGYLAAMVEADQAYLDQLVAEFPVTDRSSASGVGGRTGEYWGLAVAESAARLGVPIGFISSNSYSDPGLRLMGSERAVNEWLNLCGYEGSFGGNKADTESKSGIFTLLSQPSHKQLFEHMYAAQHGMPIEDVIIRDPMAAVIRHEQTATALEIIDHEGFMRMYEENPEATVGMYLARQVPHLKHLRNTIAHTERSLNWDPVSEITDGMDTRTRKMLEGMAKEQAKIEPRQKASLANWQADYDLTASLLMEGHKPYALPDVAQYVHEYVVGLLAVHPEISPSNKDADIPDVKGRIVKMMIDLQEKHGDD